MTEIKRLIDEKTFGRLQALKERLPHGKKEKQGASTPSRPVRKKADERGRGVGGQTTTRNQRRRRRGRNENQAKRKEQ